MNAAQLHADLVADMKALGAPLSADDITHHLCAGIYAKQIRIAAGSVVMSHQHAFDHLSILASGHVRVITDAGEAIHTAPATILIRKGLNHAVHALADSVWFCVHATDETDLERIDDALIERSPS
ncbi:MAG: hypothetical protein PVS3B2_00380 [Candidatus Dormibacteraceae bacterium]